MYRHDEFHIIKAPKGRQVAPKGAQESLVANFYKQVVPTALTRNCLPIDRIFFVDSTDVDLLRVIRWRSFWLRSNGRSFVSHFYDVDSRKLSLGFQFRQSDHVSTRRSRAALQLRV